MEALNKKIPGSKEFLQFSNSLSFMDITLAILASSTLSAFFQFSRYGSGIFAVFTFLIFLSLVNYRPRQTLVTIIIIAVLTLEQSIESAAILSIIIGLIALNKVLSNISDSFSLAVISTLTHLGDAISTYMGLTKGFTEANPVINYFIANSGNYSIFAIKSMILPIIVYCYFKLPEEESEMMLKLIYSIGLYLSISNILIYL